MVMEEDVCLMRIALVRISHQATVLRQEAQDGYTPALNNTVRRVGVLLDVSDLDTPRQTSALAQTYSHFFGQADLEERLHDSSLHGSSRLRTSHSTTILSYLVVLDLVLSGIILDVFATTSPPQELGHHFHLAILAHYAPTLITTPLHNNCTTIRPCSAIQVNETRPIIGSI